MLIAEFLLPCLEAGGGGSEDANKSSTSASSTFVSSSNTGISVAGEGVGVDVSSITSGAAVGGSARVGGDGYNT